MAELEKTIQGLTFCLKESIKVACDGCPYRGGGCMDYLMADALSLLQEKEPRVMHADEIVLSAEPSGWLWLEMENGHCGEAYKAGITISGFIIFGHGFDSSFTTLFPENYGKTWRCWTSRPTDEQRGAISWN